MNDNNDTYWCARPTDDFLDECFKRIDGWFKHVKESGKLDLYRTALREYYAGAETGGRIGTAGEQEEFTTIKVNHLHNLGEHIVMAVAGQPPTFTPEALNSDHESTAHTVVANGVLEQAVAQRGLDALLASVTRFGVVLSEGWASLEWDEGSGEDYAADPRTGQVIKTGDVRYRKFAPIDVVRDWLRDSGEDHEWVITRRWDNRFNVIARLMRIVEDPEQMKAWQDRILALPNKASQGQGQDRPLLTVPSAHDESDEIAVYELRHARTDAMPEGRRTVFVDPEVMLEDGPLRYRDLMVYRLAPEEQIGSERGYTPMFDLLALQHAINASYSTVLSNHNTLGHPMIWVKPSSNFSSEQLQAYTILKAEEKPEAITLTQTPAEIPAFAKDLIQQMEIISGVNPVRRGNLDATGKLSGSAYAIIDAKFLESVIGLMSGFRVFASRVATGTIWLYQDFAKAEHTLRVVGKSNRAYVDTFTGDSLKKVNRVDVELGNPMSRTSAGRLELATRLMTMVDPVTGKPNGIQTPEQFIQVVTTGRLEPMTEGTSKELDNIKAENEMLGDGEMPIAVAIDNHPRHIQEHSGVLSSPESRTNTAIVQATLDHIQSHMDLWTTTDPRTLAARGIQPPPAPMPPPGMTMPGAPGATDGTQPPAPGAGPDVSAPPGAEGQPQMPQMPIDPSTGEQAPAPAVM